MTGIIITLLIVLCKIPLINLLGDKGFGYYSTALIIYLLLMTLISYGLPKAVSTVIAEQCSKGHYKLVYKTTISSLIFALIAGGCFAAIVFLGAQIIAVYLMGAAFSVYAIRGFAPCLMFISVLGVLHGVYAGTRAAAVSKTMYYIEEFFVAALSIAGAYIFTGIGTDIARTKGDLLYEAAYSALGASLGFTCGVFIALVFALVIFIKYRKKLKRLADKDRSEIRISTKEILLKLIKTMLPFILTIAVFHLSNVVDYAVFNKIMNVQGHKENSYIILFGMQNGKYEFFISLPLLFVNWFAASKVPVLTKIVQEGNQRKIHNKIGQCMRYVMLFIFPCTVFYVLYAKPLMTLAFSGINDTPAMLLRVGAVSVIFYSLTIVSNAIINTLDDWTSVVKNACISLIIQFISLLIMMIIFQWGIIAVVASRIVFATSLFVLNEHTLRECTGYIQDQKRTFKLPAIAALIMGGISFAFYFILELFVPVKIVIIIVFFIAVLAYVLSLILVGGITQREMYRIPGGKFLAPLCKKLHLIK